MIVLNKLPEEHPLRNIALGEIEAEYRWKHASSNVQWRTVKVGAPKLVDKTYNQLGEAWTNSDWWVTNAM